MAAHPYFSSVEGPYQSSHIVENLSRIARYLVRRLLVSEAKVGVLKRDLVSLANAIKKRMLPESMKLQATNEFKYLQ
jgi:hypothetical protein